MRYNQRSGRLAYLHVLPSAEPRLPKDTSQRDCKRAAADKDLFRLQVCYTCCSCDGLRSLVAMMTFESLCYIDLVIFRIKIVISQGKSFTLLMNSTIEY